MESTLKRTWSEIDLDALIHNYRTLRKRVGDDVKFLGVVKADAYGHGAIEVSKALEENGTEPQAVTLGIRPEHISLCAAGDPQPHLDASVDVCEMMGSSMHLHVRSGEKNVVLVLRTIDLPLEKRAGFAFGDPVSFTFDSSLLHLFSAETGRNLI